MNNDQELLEAIRTARLLHTETEAAWAIVVECRNKLREAEQVHQQACAASERARGQILEYIWGYPLKAVDHA